ncbi:MAG: hypothetical protein ACI9GW_002715 [Halieaceae bacterium]|jgi:hypothetical protein
MLTAASYQFAWTVYLGSVLALAICFFFLLRRFATIKLVLAFEIFVVAILLIPVSAEPGSEFLAPALIVGMFEFTSLGPDEVARSGGPLLVMGGGVLAIEALIFMAIYIINKRNRKQIDTIDT